MPKPKDFESQKMKLIRKQMQLDIETKFVIEETGEVEDDIVSSGYKTVRNFNTPTLYGFH